VIVGLVKVKIEIQTEILKRDLKPDKFNSGFKTSTLGYKSAMEAYKISGKSQKELNLHEDQLVELSSVLSLLLLFFALAFCSTLGFIAEVIFNRHSTTKIVTHFTTGG